MLEPRRTALLLLTALACTGLPQCSSGPPTKRVVGFQAGQKVVVAYRDPSVGFSLINQSALTPADGMQARKADPSLKIVQDQDLQVLLDVFGGRGFFEAATTPQPGRGKSELIVAVEGKEPWSLTSMVRREFAEAWAHSVEAFMLLYNAHESLAGSRLTAEELKAASRRANAPTRKRPTP